MLVALWDEAAEARATTPKEFAVSLRKRWSALVNEIESRESSVAMTSAIQCYQFCRTGYAAKSLK
jgi:hypothetical protein